jgi:hypothetical protein
MDIYLYLRGKFKVTYFNYKSMKKQLFIIVCIISVGFTSSGQTVNKVKSVSATKEVKTIPDFNVALKFINDYISFCIAIFNKYTSLREDDWVANNQLVTNSFKINYKKLITDALKKDPELGLDFDPILNAQDYPEKGCSILKKDVNTGYVTVIGNDWKNYTLVLKVVYQNNKWLVDGAGIINIPENKRAKE